MIERPAIAGLVPHAGSMCLIDRVLHWDAAGISCTSASHRLVGNPLARRGAIAAICGVEYAAQAMAIHGRLVDADAARPRAGFLASLRDVACSADRLDLVDGDLTIAAGRLFGDGNSVIYRFTVHGDDDRLLLSGQAAVVLAAAPP
ncbi:MAG: putative beta-hydroxyacyl-acyl carrier protein (ACP)-dehydratase [Rhodospirillales bacterium]|jgi:predicted hotdog family 3-hydroxylacyl-ACP dehydratase|nr:putative beta-hydroxyacyl-acyl carrier protein (ACP)-dehydratase [Rhodospirillales bacterium]